MALHHATGASDLDNRHSFTRVSDSSDDAVLNTQSVHLLSCTARDLSAQNFAQLSTRCV